MDPEYQKGIQIGELMGEIKSLRLDVQKYRDEQLEWNKETHKRLTIAEQWIQTTTGKVVILTTIFGIVGSVCYVAINWFINHYLKP